jgi:hypothetical protein
MAFYISGPKVLFETTEISTHPNSTQQESNYIYLYTTKFGTSITIRLNRKFESTEFETMRVNCTIVSVSINSECVKSGYTIVSVSINSESVKSGWTYIHSISTVLQKENKIISPEMFFRMNDIFCKLIKIRCLVYLFFLGQIKIYVWFRLH